MTFTEMKVDKIRTNIPLMKYDGVCVYEKSGYIYVTWLRSKWQNDQNGRTEILDYRSKRFPGRMAAQDIIDKIIKES